MDEETPPNPTTAVEPAVHNNGETHTHLDCGDLPRDSSAYLILASGESGLENNEEEWIEVDEKPEDGEADEKESQADPQPNLDDEEAQANAESEHQYLGGDEAPANSNSNEVTDGGHLEKEEHWGSFDEASLPEHENVKEEEAEVEGNSEDDAIEVEGLQPESQPNVEEKEGQANSESDEGTVGNDDAPTNSTSNEVTNGRDPEQEEYSLYSITTTPEAPDEPEDTLAIQEPPRDSDFRYYTPFLAQVIDDLRKGHKIVLRKGQLVSVTAGKNDASSWLAHNQGGVSGWVPVEYLELVESNAPGFYATEPARVAKVFGRSLNPSRAGGDEDFWEVEKELRGRRIQWGCVTFEYGYCWVLWKARSKESAHVLLPRVLATWPMRYVTRKDGLPLEWWERRRPGNVLYGMTMPISDHKRCRRA